MVGVGWGLPGGVLLISCPPSLLLLLLLLIFFCSILVVNLNQLFNWFLPVRQRQGGYAIGSPWGCDVMRQVMHEHLSTCLVVGGGQ